MSSARSAVRFLAAGAASGVALTFAATAASAHVTADPSAVEAGTSSTVSFTLEHGCDGSPTVKLQMKIPDGFTDVSAPEKDGWTATVSTGEVVWEGGPLDASTQDSFELTLTAPTPGDYAMPVIQTCEAGSLSWVQEAVEGQPEPDLPAPMLKVTEGAPTDEDLAGGHGHDEAAATDDTGADHHAEDAATDDTGADHHAEEDASGSEPNVISPAPSKDDDSNTGLIVGIVVAAIVVLGGGGYALSRRGKAPKA